MATDPSVEEARAEAIREDRERRETLFRLLAGMVQNTNPRGLSAHTTNPDHVRNQLVVETFCSNNEGGSTVTRQTAEAILLGKRELLPTRDLEQDARELEQLWRALNDPSLAHCNPTDHFEWVEQLRQKHRIIMRENPEIQPGDFKEFVNLAGEHDFAWPQNVAALLKLGHELSVQLPAGLARTIFQHFFLIEVHPFENGNGRTSRMVANAELTQSGLERCVVTFKHRSHIIRCADAFYDGTDDGTLLVAAWQACQEWTRSLNWSNLEQVWQTLERDGHIAPSRSTTPNSDGNGNGQG